MKKFEMITTIVLIGVSLLLIDIARFNTNFNHTEPAYEVTEYIEYETVESEKITVKEVVQEYIVEKRTTNDDENVSQSHQTVDLEVRNMESTSIFVKIPEKYVQDATYQEIYLVTPQGNKNFVATNLQEGNGEYFHFYRFDNIVNKDLAIFLQKDNEVTYQKVSVEGKCVVVFDNFGQFDHVTYF